jgi:transcriptional regulator with XRE-family HTH domain
MSLEEIKDREDYFKEFGEILVRRHGQNYYSSFHNERRMTVDETAERFARYLRAARVNAGLSIEQLAKQSRLSKATLIALEQGLVLACDIKPRWLKDLAEALAENVEDFNLILGRQISSSNSRWLTERLITRWRNRFNYSKFSLFSKPLYAAGSALLICFVIGAATILSLNPLPPTQTPKDTYTFIDIKPGRRLNMIKAELYLENQVLVVNSNIEPKTCCVH